MVDDALPRELTPVALDDELSAWFARSSVTRSPGLVLTAWAASCSAQFAHDNDAATGSQSRAIGAGTAS